ncbi:MAG: M6 family metalloprotease domain-containing protein [Bacteroidales bacterium]|nr:M6 family metalloprotease domain-containing protein [Bacteroidales bacterium]
MRPKPTCLRRLSLILYICCCLAPALTASPAWRGLLNLRQPDGTVVQAYLTGDENGHLVLTPDGCALVQDAEGWWCYARYDFYGHRLNTGEHAGDPDTPGEVIAASRNIPYQLIRQRRAARIRQALPLREKERARTRSGESGGIRHGLIILAQFPDEPFTYSRTDFENLINGQGPETALSYFKDQWKGSYTFRFDITEIVTLPQNYAYYGANNEDGEDEKAAEMIIDACTAVGPEVNFSDYDNDGDGEVDNVFVFFSGPNESEGAGDNRIWPHMWYVQSGAGITYSRDGVLVDNYACTSELRLDSNLTTFTTLATIGTFCHEYTHTFGIPDLYDTDSEDSGGYSEAMWNCIDLMDAGNHNNEGKTPPNYSAVERWFFEMSEGKPLTEGVHTLRPVHENGDYYFMETDDNNEIFLFECRKDEGWDAHIGGNGLLIYHLDWSQRPAGESTSAGKVVKAWERWDLNEVNARPDHQCIDLIEPDPEARQRYQTAVKNRNYQAIYTLASHAYWPFFDASVFTSDTDPSFTFWSGNTSSLGLTDIRRNADGSVTFTVFNAQEDKAPAVKVDNQVVFQDASIIQWSSLDPSFTGNSIIRYGLADDAQLVEVEVRPYETGKYAFVLDGLTPSTAYKVQLLCRKGSIPGPVNGNASFTTKSDRKAGSYPYIYLKDINRGTGGSFAPDTPIALRVYNAADAVRINWYFDGKPIAPGADGYYHLSRSGVLKAVVTYPGSTDIITKKIVVK